MQLKDGTIIIVWDKNKGEYIDKTEEIESYKQIENSFQVKFYSSQKYYTYAETWICKLIETIDTADKAVIYSGTALLNICKVQVFQNDFYKVYNGNSWSLLNNVSIIPKSNDQTSNYFDYYKKMAEFQAKVSNNDESVGSYIFSQYEKIRNIKCNSVLRAYLLKEQTQLPQMYHDYIFPFEFNMSQYNAIKTAFNNQISVIEGPPGCGKTETILNFIANAIIKNKTVAVVSNNNAAIKNIYDKLTKCNLSFCCALLGKNDNKKEFFDNTSSNLVDSFNKYYSDNKISDYNFASALELLERLQTIEVELKIQYQGLENLKKEYQHFQANTQILELSINPNLSSSQYKSVSLQLENISNISFFKRVYINHLLKIKTQTIDKVSLINAVDNFFYIAYITETKKKIAQYEDTLKKHNYKEIKKQYIQASINHFVDKLKKIAKINTSFDIATYKDNFESFLERYPVILSTSYSIMGSIKKTCMLDYVIFDEASQSDLLSSVLALKCAKNLVVVGDSKQLPEITEQNVSEYSKAFAVANKIPDEYWYHSESILSSIKKVFPNVKTTFLREHYRCNPRIINFCNQKFYDGKLIIMTKPKDASPFEIIHTVSGNHARKNPNGSGMYNQREIDEIVATNTTWNDEVGIITPFRYQADMIKKSINGCTECDTVHKFQGRSKDHIFLSTVLNSIGDGSPNRMEDFVTNEKLLNVAVSRAANKLTLLVSDNIYNSNANTSLNDLIKYIKYQSDSVIKYGEVVSVFDILYNFNNKKLQKIRQKVDKKHYLSEELIKILLTEILNSFPSFGFARHIPLRKIISNIKNIDPEKQRYLTHPLTHTDFLIYNKITHIPLFVIEVDGIAFHEKSEIQRQHDIWKDDCLTLHNIPVLRLKTNGSGEKVKILEQIKFYM